MSDICQKGEDNESHRKSKIDHRDPAKVVGDKRGGKEHARKKCMMK